MTMKFKYNEAFNKLAINNKNNAEEWIKRKTITLKLENLCMGEAPVTIPWRASWP